MATFDFPILSATAIDGDTLRATLDLGLGVRYDTHIRVDGIDTPEMKGPSRSAAATVRTEVAAWLVAHGTALRVRSTKWDKYGGRIVGHVYATNLADGREVDALATWLLARGFAKAYKGKAKVVFTENDCKRIVGAAGPR